MAKLSLYNQRADVVVRSKAKTGLAKDRGSPVVQLRKGMEHLVAKWDVEAEENKRQPLFLLPCSLSASL